ncbi:Cytidine and dCMP deaminase domain-containing protein 1 [Stylophora pistillata]|uniref:Cytidine and dCMP deaminase domain-containing protein 1 n=1 Tax=Stylophora pistillata TaxID=50429 RepID=A0A2B4R775_STYPI|nr:Cytidine and dCMP deaminase domain-containing protein 1 [Stylophora pistillata]
MPKKLKDWQKSLKGVPSVSWERPNLEASWLNITMRSQSFLVGCVYRPPDDSSFFHSFRDLITNIWLKRKNVILVGDFNSYMLHKPNNRESEYGKRLRWILCSCGLKNIINSPTRISANSKSLIDLVFTSQPSKIQTSGSIDLGISDHHLIFAVFKVARGNAKPKVIPTRNYNSLDTRQLRSDFDQAPWHTTSLFDDIDDSVDAWHCLYNEILNHHPPPRDAKIRDKALPWINTSIRKEMNKRYKLLKRVTPTRDKTDMSWELVKNKLIKAASPKKATGPDQTMEEKSGQGNEPTPSTGSPAASGQHSLPQDETKGTESNQRETRMKKENLYMVLALWMESFPVMEQRDNAKHVNKVGVVFVLPTDRVLTADCSRDGVHGVARVMINHCGKLEGCKVFVSRKPCSLCAKLLVQSRVSRLFYLPTQPESDNEEELETVDNLFKTSSVGQSVFVPYVDQRVLDRVKRELPKEITSDEISKDRDELFKKWWSDEWSALYGEFPRASDDDSAHQKKFPYVIHAEQNALLVRNAKDLTNGTLFVTKPPCDECAPMIKLTGVKTIVVGEMIEKSQGGYLSYNLIKEYIKKKEVKCYQMELKATE